MSSSDRSRYLWTGFDQSVFARRRLEESALLESIYDRSRYGRFRYDRPFDQRSTYEQITSNQSDYSNRYQHSTPKTDLVDASVKHSSEGTCPHCHQLLNSVQSSSAKFQTCLNKFFPGALELEEFVFRTKQTLVPRGFYPHVNTFVCVGLCRDEITSPFEEEIEAMWGQAFICGSLGGMLFCGKTGFSAAHHHAPDTARIIYYCFTHIAIDHQGLIGSVYRTRSGMNEKTTACGALAAFTNEIASNQLNLTFDENDIEMSMLRKHIIDQSGLSIDPKNAPDLLQVTLAAYRTITMDLERHAQDDAQTFRDRQYALFTGVQIHGPEGSDYCWLGKASLLINGQLSPLKLTTNNSFFIPPTEHH